MEKDGAKVVPILVFVVIIVLASILQSQSSKVTGMASGGLCNCYEHVLFDYEYCPPPDQDIIKSCTLKQINCLGGSACTAQDLKIKTASGDEIILIGAVNQLGPEQVDKEPCPGQAYTGCPSARTTKKLFDWLY